MEITIALLVSLHHTCNACVTRKSIVAPSIYGRVKIKLWTGAPFFMLSCSVSQYQSLSSRLEEYCEVWEIMDEFITPADVKLVMYRRICRRCYTALELPAAGFPERNVNCLEGRPEVRLKSLVGKWCLFFSSTNARHCRINRLYHNGKL